MNQEYYDKLADSITKMLDGKNLNVNEVGGELEQRLIRYQLVLTNGGVNEADRRFVANETARLLEFAKLFPDSQLPSRGRK